MKTYLSSLLLEEQTYFQFPRSPVHQRRNQKSWRIHISGKSMYSLYCSQFHTEFLQWMSIHYGSTYHNCHTELLCDPLEQHHCKDPSQLYSLYNTKLHHQIQFLRVRCQRSPYWYVLFVPSWGTNNYSLIQEIITYQTLLDVSLTVVLRRKVTP